VKNGNRAERQHLEYQGLQQAFFMRNYPYNNAKIDSYYLPKIYCITMQKNSCFLTSLHMWYKYAAYHLVAILSKGGVERRERMQLHLVPLRHNNNNNNNSNR